MEPEEMINPHSRGERSPTVSVIIPVLNAEKTIGDQLDALASQDYQGDWELIVADNGSSDGTARVVREYKRALPNLRLINASERKNRSFARNVGVALAQGDTLIFLDADDQVDDQYVAMMARAISTYGFVAGRVDTRSLNPDWIVEARDVAGQETGLMRWNDFLPCANGGTLGVTRRIFEELGGFDERFPSGQDFDFCWRAHLAGFPLHFVPRAIVRYRYPDTPRDVFRQARRFGRAHPNFYKKFRSFGMKRPPIKAAIVEWRRLILGTRRLKTKTQRAKWLFRLGIAIGRIEGSIRFRTVFL